MLILLERVAHLLGKPDELRNCLTVDALIPKFTFSGIDPTILANFTLLSWETTTPVDVYFGRGQEVLEERSPIKRKALEYRRLQHRENAA